MVLNEWEQSFLFLFALVAGLLGLVMLLSSLQHHLGGPARLVAGLTWIGDAAFFFRAGRSGLIVEKDGVTLRGIIRRRHWTWSEIEGFELKFVVYFPPMKINFKDGRHVRVRGWSSVLREPAAPRPPCRSR